MDAPKKVHKNLFEYTEQDLLHDKVLNHYELLGVPDHSNADQIKKAFRKASLTYHPDKMADSSAGEYVFLALRQAHDTLMDPAKRQAYDSTILEFDESIPPDRNKLIQEDGYTDDDFYKVYEPVFLRNLRFDARMKPDGKKKTIPKAPTLGDSSTPIAQVHAFYDYWVHFDSWRDFSDKAAQDLQISQELENAESRYEKRWLQKEIDKRSKQYKRQEIQRIQTLVNRAREADPRLRAEREAMVQAKQEAQMKRERLAQEKKEAEAQKKERIKQEQLAQQERLALEKVEREQAKKQLRKMRQTLRRMASASFESSSEHADKPWIDSYEMNVDVDYLCQSLSHAELEALHSEVSRNETPHAILQALKQKASLLKEQGGSDRDVTQSTTTTSTTTTATTTTTTSTVTTTTETTSDTADINSAKTTTTTTTDTIKTNGTSTDSGKLPWTKDELSALAKAVRKYPPGGASRWDQITLWVNNLCKQDFPRTKEECIEKYNAVARSANKPDDAAAVKKNGQTNGAANTSNGSTSNNGNSKPAPAAVTPDSTDKAEAAATDDAAASSVWSSEQDQELQDGLAKYPASMDKNERWTLIAQGVSGKTKKQCVQRFKEIREALMQKNK
jgi:DnaJ homolog subfamily C member 2